MLQVGSSNYEIQAFTVGLSILIANRIDVKKSYQTRQKSRKIQPKLFFGCCLICCVSFHKQYILAYLKDSNAAAHSVNSDIFQSSDSSIWALQDLTLTFISQGLITWRISSRAEISARLTGLKF